MNIEQLIKDCASIKNLTKMDGSPVAITYGDEIPDGRFRTDRQVICQSLQDARYGDEIALSTENSICKGGNYFVGLTAQRMELYKFWVDIEQTSATRCLASSLNSRLPSPPLGMADFIMLSPVEKIGRMPDLVLFVLEADETARLLGLNAYCSGIPVNIYSYAAACAAAIGIPAVTGNLHVSFIDNSARYIADFKNSELIITIPSLKIHEIADSIDNCVWGTAKVPYHFFEDKLKGTWVKKDLAR